MPPTWTTHYTLTDAAELLDYGTFLTEQEGLDLYNKLWRLYNGTTARAPQDYELPDASHSQYDDCLWHHWDKLTTKERRALDSAVTQEHIL